MHVAAVVAGFDPHSGGGHTFEREIVRALAAKAVTSAHRFTVLCPQTAHGALSATLAGSGIDVAAVPRRSGRLASLLFREVEAVRAHWRRPSDIDRVAKNLGAQFVWFVSAQPDRTDLPYMTVVWDLQHRASPWFPEMSAGGQWDQREAMHRWFLQRATKVITGTEIGRAQLKGFFQVAEDNILVLPHPTPADVLHEADEAKSGSADVASRFGLRAPFVLYPAQFWPHKNHANLVLAIARLKQQGLAVLLALPGSDHGNRAFVLQLAEREGVADLVRPLGFVARADLVALYREALALTYVSWCGPENLPPLEAFALGCPVIATRIAGADEQLADAALFCDPGDPDDIARAIRSFHDDDEMRRRFIASGRRRAARFTPPDYVAGVFEFLDQFEAIRRCWP